MTNVNDAFMTALEDFSGSINDRRKARMLEYLGKSEGQLNDLEYEILGDLGYSGALNDRWDAYLKALGGAGLSALGELMGSTFYGYSPLGLFRNGEQGAWYDPSDLTTLFTDTAGTTPATVGSAVALMLDKSKGAGYSGGTFTGLIGSQLVTNGTFDTDLTGWTLLGATLPSWLSGAVRIQNTSDLRQSFSTTAGRTYFLSYNVSGAGVTGSFLNVGTSSGNNNIVNLFIPAGGRVVFVAQTATTHLRFLGNVGADFTLDNISVRELPGNHATQSVLAQRPILRQTAGGLYYLECDGLDDGMVTSAINFTATDKVTVFTGVRKLSDAALGMLLEFGPTVNGTIGTFSHLLPDTSLATSLGLDLRGNGTSGIQRIATGAAPNTFVSSVVFDLAGTTFDTERPVKRINGANVASGSNAGSTDTGGGNFSTQILYLFRRAGSSLPLNGHFYGGIILGRTATAAEITNTERYLAQKTGVTLA